MTILYTNIKQVAQHSDVGLDLSVYNSDILDAILDRIVNYLEKRHQPPPRRSWWPWRRVEEPTRISPLLLSGPVGTGKTTLMMLIDRALPEASCASLFAQALWGHPTTAQNAQKPVAITVHPLPLMGSHTTLPTGVIRLRDLQTFYRLYTYNRQTAGEDLQAAEQFAHLFKGHVVFIDEFVPDTVSSFPMKVINHLANHGVLVVLSSNRKETPFVEGVQVVSIDGEDMRKGDLALVCRPATPDPRFDRFKEEPSVLFNHVARGLRARLLTIDDTKWMYLNFENIAFVPADWLAFQHLLQYTDGILIDEVPVFDLKRGSGVDSARRFSLLVDAIYSERRPVLVRLTNSEPLAVPFDADILQALYIPEIVIDLERTISRLRQLSVLQE